MEVVRLCKYRNGHKKPLITAIIRGGLILVLVIQLIKERHFSSIQFKFITFVPKGGPIYVDEKRMAIGLFGWYILLI